MKTEIKLLMFAFTFLLIFSCKKEEGVSPSEFVTPDPEITSNITDRTNTPGVVLDHAICKTTLQGTWIKTGSFDHENNPLTFPSFFVYMSSTLHFTNELIELDWIDHVGFNMLDYTPSEAHDCYHAMYKINCDDRLIDIADLYCSMPTVSVPPPAGRCGPPQFQRFKIIKLTNDEVEFESVSASWNLEGLDDSIYNIPDADIVRYVFQRV